MGVIRRGLELAIAACLSSRARGVNQPSISVSVERPTKRPAPEGWSGGAAKERQVGKVDVRGPSVAVGNWNDPERAQVKMNHGFLGGSLERA